VRVDPLETIVWVLRRIYVVALPVIFSLAPITISPVVFVFNWQYCVLRSNPIATESSKKDKSNFDYI
jgi:hypothetical protein